MKQAPMLALRRLLTPAFLATVIVVVAVIAPLGIAMTGHIEWVTAGALVWTVLFGYSAARRGRSPVAWAITGGVICGIVWALAEIVGHALLMRGLGTWTNFAVVAVAAGLGGGALIGTALGPSSSDDHERRLRLAALLLGGGLGLSAGIALFMSRADASLGPRLLFLILGVAVGLSTAIPGRALGLWFRPAVLFFEQLWPYLREMALPLAAFSVGFFSLTLGFAGLYGTVWHFNPQGACRAVSACSRGPRAGRWCPARSGWARGPRGARACGSPPAAPARW